MSKKRSFGSWAAIVPLSAAIGAYLLFVFMPSMRDINRMRSEMSDKQAMVVQAASLPAKVDEIDAQMQATREYLSQWRGVSAKPAEVAKLFGTVANLMKSSGATSTAFRPEQKVSLAVVERVPLTLGCRGSFQQVQAFLTSVESLKQLIWIEEALLERDRQDARLVSCELKLAIFADKFEFSH